MVKESEYTHCKRRRDHSTNDYHKKIGGEITRRTFIKCAPLGMVGITFGLEWLSWVKATEARGHIARKADRVSTVALVKGDDRRDNMFTALKLIEEDIRKAIGNKQVVIKPNFVSVRRQLAATHVDSVTAILDVLKSFYKRRVIIAESPAFARAEVGFENFGYKECLKGYDVTFCDLDDCGYKTLFILDKNLHPLPIRVSKLVLDPNIYLISAAVLKTHDTVVATLSLKNVVMGAPLRNDKPKVHQGIRQINFNLFSMAQRVRPDLAMIDGFEGMEGDGPIAGDPVDARVAIVSNDFLAADRVAVAVMGVDFANIGYLNYCAQAGMGEPNLDNIRIVGHNLAECVIKFRLHKDVEKQYLWK